MSMHDYSRLPTEILHHIFKYLHDNYDILEDRYHSDLFQCLLVCKKWKSLSIDHLYRTVYLTDLERAQKFIECTKISKLGHLCYDLSFFRLLGDDEAIEFLPELAKVTPNVKRFNTNKPPRWFWLDFAQVCARYWKNLEKIPYPSMDDFVEYNICALQHQQTLKEIFLPDDDPKNDRGRNIIRQLKYFPNMQDVQIESAIYTARPVDYDELIDNCPRLTHLLVMIDEMEEVDEEDYEWMPQYDLATLKPCETMKDLCFIFNYDKYSIDYIMLKFPRLKRLDLAVHLPLTGSIQTKHDTYLSKNIEVLVNYAIQIPKFNISFYGPIDLVPPFLKHSKALEIYFSENDWDRHGFRDDDVTLHPSLEFTNDSACISFEDEVQPRELMRLWQLCMDIVTEMTFHSPTDYDQAEIQDRNLENILLHCKKLRSFQYNANFLRPPVQKTRNLQQPMLETLELHVRQINKEVFPIYSRCMPALKDLTIRTVFEGDSKVNFDLKMPKTALNSLVFFATLRLKHREDSDRMVVLDLGRLSTPAPYILLKVETEESGLRHYVIFRTDGKTVIEEADTSLSNEIAVTIHLKLLSIQTISLQIADILLKNHSFNL